MRYFIELQFKGTNYCGWQIQPHSKSVQGELNEKLSLLLKENISTVGAGRTDTGVHAKHFVAHFDYHNDLSSKMDTLVYKLNNFLSNDIVVKQIKRMHNDAHARFDASSRTYKYYITTSKNAFQQEFAWQMTYSIDMMLLNRASEKIIEYTDFSSFSKSHTDVKTNNCKIKECYWEQSDEFLFFTVTADRFLRNMVRAMVGTLIDIGRGKTKISELEHIMQLKDRSMAGESAPAQGLFLHRIEYPYAI